MPQFIAFAVSVFVAFSIATAASYGVAPHHVRSHMPPQADVNPHGVSGGGPVGSVPEPIPSPIAKAVAGS